MGLQRFRHDIETEEQQIAKGHIWGWSALNWSSVCCVDLVLCGKNVPTDQSPPLSMAGDGTGVSRGCWGSVMNSHLASPLQFRRGTLEKMTWHVRHILRWDQMKLELDHSHKWCIEERWGGRGKQVWPRKDLGLHLRGKVLSQQGYCECTQHHAQHRTSRRQAWLRCLHSHLSVSGNNCLLCLMPPRHT